MAYKDYLDKAEKNTDSFLWRLANRRNTVVRVAKVIVVVLFLAALVAMAFVASR